MTIPAASRLRERLELGDSIDVRGLGKAGGGLVLAMQAFAEAITSNPYLDVQDWPLFSSARKGANVTAYLRIARGRVENTSRVASPDIALLMNEAAAEDADFAEGTDGAIYVLNTALSPQQAAKNFRLAGTIVTVPGDQLGLKHLGRPLANVAVLAAIVHATELVELKEARSSVEHRFEKRRVPRRIIDSNLAVFDEALSLIQIAEIAHTPEAHHKTAPFRGYGELPAGAQSRLRTSSSNRTSGYGRPGVVVEFNDPAHKCNGCSLCVVQCPEGIIQFNADPDRGAIVHGARFSQYCKKCRECISACPLNLFSELDVVTPPEGRIEGA